MSRISQEQFAAQVGQRSAGDYHYPTVGVLSLATPRAQVDVRYAGAYITEATMTDQNDRQVPVLYSDSNLSAAKLNASHGMTVRDELSGQHGPGRWADWRDITPGYMQRRNEAYAMLRAELPAEETVRLERSFRLSDAGLTITSTAANEGDGPLDFRLGEHLYFSLPGGDLDDVRVLSHELPLSDPKVQETICQNGWYWPDFDGDMTVQLPDKRLRIRSSCTMLFNDSGFDEKPLGIMFWQRQGTESICIEPLWGYADGVTDLDGGGIKLKAGSVATLKTTILLLD